ncbi:MAG: hypothetical protein D3913_01395 [Candidatus Electrothrix sp. LOE1_4_5]|nr:hypothetical protein [Candidatus Electrothrix gigas]
MPHLLPHLLPLALPLAQVQAEIEKRGLYTSRCISERAVFFIEESGQRLYSTFFKEIDFLADYNTPQ